MKKYLFSIMLLSLSLIFSEVNPGFCSTVAAVSSPEYKAGDVVTIDGTIDSGKDLFIVISSQSAFAPKDTEGVHEIKRLTEDAKKKGFTKDTSIPDLYYLLTTIPDKFGKIVKKKFGGPSFFTQNGKRGLYEKEGSMRRPCSSCQNSMNSMQKQRGY